MDARTHPLARAAHAAGLASLMGMLAFGTAWAQQVATLPGGAGMPAATRSPAAAMKTIQLPNGGLMLQQTDVAMPVPGMPVAAASAPAAKASLAGSGLVVDGAVLQLANTTPPSMSPAVPAERQARRAGLDGQVVLARTDDTPPASTAAAPKRRVVVLQDGKLPAFPEPDVLYRLP